MFYFRTCASSALMRRVKPCGESRRKRSRTLIDAYKELVTPRDSPVPTPSSGGWGYDNERGISNSSVRSGEFRFFFIRKSLIRGMITHTRVNTEESGIFKEEQGEEAS